MKLNDKFGIRGIDDERQRRVLFPVRVVLTKGNVRGAENLTAYKPAQVAIYGYHDQCVLDNRGSDENAAVLVDFGRELHGTLTVSVWSMNAAYHNYTVRLGESVSEALTPIGEKNATNDHANRDMKTGSGPWSSNETNESGFRFAYVELTSPGAMMEIRCLTATLVFRDIEYRGSFTCSDPLLDRIWDTAAYTVHLNMQRYLWDGIKRDRLVWAGDMNTEIETILAVFGENEVVPKSLDLVRDVTPTDASMNGISAYNLWWILCHEAWYLGTGNYAYLAEQKDYIRELLERYAGYVDENGSETLPAGRFFDWPTNNYPDATHAGLQGLLRMALRGGGSLMTVLGESAAAETCYRAADRLLAHLPAYGEWKQPAALLALSGRTRKRRSTPASAWEARRDSPPSSAIIPSRRSARRESTKRFSTSCADIGGRCWNSARRPSGKTSTSTGRTARPVSTRSSPRAASISTAISAPTATSSSATVSATDGHPVPRRISRRPCSGSPRRSPAVRKFSSIRTSPASTGRAGPIPPRTARSKSKSRRPERAARLPTA